MRRGLLALPLLALPLACSFSSQGEPEGGGDDELANTGSETATDGLDEVGTEQGSSGESTGDGDGDPTTTTDDDDPTTDSTESTDTSTESTTDDTSTESTETDTDTTDTSDTSTETGMEETYYGDCPNGSDDCALGEVCKTDADLLDDWQVCGTPCENSNDCPPANGLPLTCISYGLQDSTCHIDCDNNDCPQGMSCKSVNFGIDHICAYG